MLEKFQSDAAVLNIYTYGSRVYGTANKNSDYDYVVVVENESAAARLEPFTRAENEDFTIYTKEQFQKNIDMHEVSALECFFLPADKVVKKTVDFSFTLDLGKLRTEFSQKSSNSWVKAKKKFVVEKDYAPYVGQKSAWHSLRILDFGCQIAKDGKITNWSETNHLLPAILKMDSWEVMDENLRLINRSKNTEFKKLAPKDGANCEVAKLKFK